MAFALTGARIFDGSHLLDGRAVVVENGRILAVPGESDLGTGIERRRVEGLLAPGFIDVQVNGGGGALYNDVRTVEGIRIIAQAHRAYGTVGLLPTFITDTREAMAEAVEAMRAALAEKVPGVLGIHLEGPFISPERKGVHNPAFMRPMEDEDIAIMTSLAEGRTVVTLAPERNSMEAIARLASAGVLVCAGHTAGDYDVVMEAIRHGLRGFTHLYNAMPPLAGRDPGPVGAALDSRNTWCGLIVDGHHVSDAALRAAIAAKGTERMMLVTDAMSVTGTDLAGFDLHGRRIHRKDGRLTTEDGTLAGSDLDMASAVRNSVNRLGLALPDALRMASLVPAAFLKLDHELGRIAPGYRASLVLLDDALQVQETWIDGRSD
ncbi:N-acetylglucosamine-6-phosphate deacetylase [Microvirga arsenatis]|uniref:N-acetylglucosamine-6-phosphate deacetylase n=1 Tax=Microvirga arsenatis TaxID=2692265 RepID=A0ABW9YV64_9HYPH|nr:N-acetylglucosamine-6-phosphate deacetylase [Microvirga arsenatis]NBJ09746.1 N-acetylglucosamine-6-phosphate deacetylase [Microvirga arsenatis]NBJ23395.1 N-acetylglucosamine-6-phosphate deacetylase [Microvirga arsenatis]